MPHFKINHVKKAFPVWMQKGARNIRRTLSRMMNCLKSVKTTPTPLKHMTTVKNSPSPLPVAQNIVTIEVKDHTATKYTDQVSHPEKTLAPLPEVNTHSQATIESDILPPRALNKSSISRPAEIEEETAVPPAGGEWEKTKLMLEQLQEYQNLIEEAYFESDNMPTDEMINTILDAEYIVFPQVLEAFNARHGMDIKYIKNINEIIETAIDRNWSGRQQFIFYSGVHAIFVDLYKNNAGNISVITIDTLAGNSAFCPENLLAHAFNNREIPQGKLSLLSFKTEAQKSYHGCKYFTIHFAKTAAKDKMIMDLHQENIKITREQAAKNYKEYALGEYIKRKPHPHTFISVAETAEYLNARYYKHSHSSTRLYALPQKRHEETIFKGANVIERASQFRVQKKQIIEPLVKEDGKYIEQKSVKERVLNFSNSLDYFRRKRIIEAEEFLQARLAKQLA